MGNWRRAAQSCPITACRAKPTKVRGRSRLQRGPRRRKTWPFDRQWAFPNALANTYTVHNLRASQAHTSRKATRPARDFLSTRLKPESMLYETTNGLYDGFQPTYSAMDQCVSVFNKIRGEGDEEDRGRHGSVPAPIRVRRRTMPSKILMYHSPA